jgi:hypothetical protein
MKSKTRPILQTLKAKKDFYMEISWNLHSWVRYQFEHVGMIAHVLQLYMLINVTYRCHLFLEPYRQTPSRSGRKAVRSDLTHV